MEELETLSTPPEDAESTPAAGESASPEPEPARESEPQSALAAEEQAVSAEEPFPANEPAQEPGTPEPEPQSALAAEEEAVSAEEPPAASEPVSVETVPAAEPAQEAGAGESEPNSVTAAEEEAASAEEPPAASEPVSVETAPPAEGTPEPGAGESEPHSVTAAEEEAISADELLAANDAAPAETAPPAEDAQLLAVLEAIVYITDEPLSLQQIAAALGEPPDRIRRLLDELVAEYEKPVHGLTIREVAGGYKMATKPEHHEAVRNFVKSLKPPLKLSLAALETLAVIAYKQPVTAPEIMEIRGVQGAGVLKTLLDRKLIATAGRKNVIGKPILYKTTREFLVQFGLKDLSELPTLKEFEEISRLALGEPEAAPEAAAAPEAPAEPAAAEPPAEPAAQPEPE